MKARSKVLAGASIGMGVSLAIVAGVQVAGHDGATTSARKPSHVVSTAAQDQGDGVKRGAFTGSGLVPAIGQLHRAELTLTRTSVQVGAEQSPSMIVPMATSTGATTGATRSSGNCQRGVDHASDSVAVTWCDPVADAEKAMADAQAEINRHRRPRRVTVTPPRYQPGTPPKVTPPSVSATPPSVSQTSDSITVTVSPTAEITPPAYTPGEPGRLEPLNVAID